MTPTFINKVEEVKQLLADADGSYQSGRYDLAMKRYDQVLRSIRTTLRRVAARKKSTTPSISTAKKRTTRREPDTCGRWRKPGSNRSANTGCRVRQLQSERKENWAEQRWLARS